MPSNVLCKPIDGRIAPLRLLAQRHQHDVVEIAAQTATQTLR